jgi:hypothetical protein
MPFLLVIAIVVMGAGIFVHAESQPSAPTPTVQGETAPTPTPTAIPRPTAISTPTIKIINSPTAKPSPTMQPKPTNIPVTSTDVSSWQYPGSQKTSETIYISAEDPKTITDWYKNKINALGYSAKSFVTTNTNEKVLNKLVAAQNSSEILIEISKNPGDSSTTIKVVLDN